MTSRSRSAASGAGLAAPARQAVLDLAVRLVATDSVNPALVPGAAGESAVAKMLGDRLQQAGFAVDVIDAGGRPSLLAVHRGRGGGPRLLLNGHLDTVGVDGMADPFGARVEGNRLRGRGAADMKGGVAGMVVAAETAVRAGVPGDVVLALVTDEEHASVGTEAVIRHLTDRGELPDACLVAEPTGLDVVVAHRGYAVVEVELTGRAAHSSQPGLGVNAVTHLGRLLAAVEAADGRVAAAAPHPLAGAGSLMATVASGGTSPFVLAGSATATIERRTVPGEPSAVALEEVQALLAALREQDPTVDARARLVLAREAWQADGSPATERLLGLLEDALGRQGAGPARAGAPYWMESALWQAAGVPTLVCGPSGGGLHAADEWLDLDQLDRFTAALADVVRRFCG
ncbi:M20/M25/M40 family metallo-hydrolase [Kineosporiaceae bacterium SCSIO 59966]|nr:M20/M25/M40 family metallo-hydrolase [Kineosporiaceae bacterium SCSIO 59966]